MTLSVTIAVGLSFAMVLVAILTWVFHDEKHRDLESWIQYGFSGETLRHVMLYYRSMGLSMLVFYVLFVVSCLALQSEGHRLFTDRGGEPIWAGPVGAAMFGLDLVLRGGFFDLMEHFDLSASPILMNRDNGWFVLYAFVFRIYYGLTLLRILVSFALIWTRLRRARRALAEPAPEQAQAIRRRGLRLRLRPGRSSSAQPTARQGPQ
ncbi:MAG: hypothetical protein NW217_05650 [Hyphomicrobiaceae bacterium]|nr:hypothetical protein [Hyphomicrobiaceae bacterium]